MNVSYKVKRLELSCLTRLLQTGACLSIGFSALAEEPPLFGDGEHDDAAAIQARLDSGVACVYLPPPKKEYLVGRTLRIPSNCELRLDRYSRIRLAPGTSALLLENSDNAKGNERVALTGGIWDFDNVRQAPNPGAFRRLWPERKDEHPWPDGYSGVGIRFRNVRELHVRGVTLRNPVTYGMLLGDVSEFTIDDVCFDYTSVNPAKMNMDGVHLDGFCHHGRITNLRGTCFDDLLALNANDSDMHFGVREGPIHDITVDGIYADYCHSAVRILSTSADCPVEHVTIRNIHGNFYRYAVGLTHFFVERKTRGRMDDITIEDCHLGKALQPSDLKWTLYHHPIILVDELSDVGKLTISNVTREERLVPEDATIDIRRSADIGQLIIQNCRQINHTDKPMKFLLNLGKVGELRESGTRLE